MRLSTMIAVAAAFAALAAATAALPPRARGDEDLARTVFDTETRFAQTLADRDAEAFASFVAEEAIFFGRKGALRGKAAVVEAWSGFFEGADAPFSWKPEAVEVLESGTLAHSSGPVFDPGGRLISTFNSVWRLEPDGKWRIVFDKGCAICDTVRAG